jgi:F0F1-type ATP synthase membrane subunit c/vacuolar-type H+-ATPase subunit K
MQRRALLAGVAAAVTAPWVARAAGTGPGLAADAAAQAHGSSRDVAKEQQGKQLARVVLVEAAASQAPAQAQVQARHLVSWSEAGDGLSDAQSEDLHDAYMLMTDPWVSGGGTAACDRPAAAASFAAYFPCRLALFPKRKLFT